MGSIKMIVYHWVYQRAGDQIWANYGCVPTQSPVSMGSIQIRKLWNFIVPLHLGTSSSHTFTMVPAYLYKKKFIRCPLFNVKFYENYFTFLINASTLNVWIQNCVGNIVGDHNTSTNVELYFMIRLWLKPWQPEYCLGECELVWIHQITPSPSSGKLSSGDWRGAGVCQCPGRSLCR